jgi:hypothetical protein
MNVLALLVTTLLLAAPGKTPSPEEQRLFDEGMRAFQAGNPREAERAWRAGYDAGQDPAFLVRIGEAEEKAGAPAEAAESYRRYLHAAPDAADRAEIEQRLARLGAAGVPAPPPAPAGDDVPGAFGDGAAPATGAPSPPASEAPGSARAHDDEVAAGRRGDEEPSGWNALNITAWVSTAATVLLLGTAGYFAASAASNKDDVNQLLRYSDPSTGVRLEYQDVAQRYQDAIRDGRHNDRVAKIALIGAGVTAALATVFFILDETRAPEDRHAAGAARTGLGLGLGLLPDGAKPGAAASLSWRF